MFQAKVYNADWIDSSKLVFPLPVDIYNNFIPPFIFHSNSIKVLCVFSEPEPFRVSNADVIKNQHLFDLILTYDEEILNSCKNSKLFVYGTTWIHPSFYKNIDINKKKFEVSFLCGAKHITEGHKLRQRLWYRQKEIKIPKTFWISGQLPIESVNNNPILPADWKNKILMFDSMFHIAIENVKINNYFSEKIIDCLVTKTIPIYWGCPNIENYFDIRGMYLVGDEEEIIYVCNNLKPDDYYNKIRYIEDNYNLCLNYCDEITMRLQNIINETFFKEENCILDGNGERVDILYYKKIDFHRLDLYQKSHYKRYEFAKEIIKIGDICGDFACGTGYGSCILAEKASKVIGVDINSKVIESIKKRYRNIPNIEFFQEDLLNLKYDSFFDSIIAFETIEHFAEDDILKLLNIFAKALKPKGILIFSVPYMQDRNEASMKFHKTFKINEEKIKNWLDATNFDIEYFKYQNYKTHIIQENLSEKDFIICVARKRDKLNFVKFDVNSIYKGHHNVTYRGIKALKSPFDYLIYQMLIFEIKPDLIIEIGTNEGGTALYLADLLNILNHGIVHTIDIEKRSNIIISQHPRIKLFTNGWQHYDIEQTKKFSKILVIDDSSHTYKNTLNVMNKFAPIVTPGSYLIVEDGIINELGMENEYDGGPLRAIEEFLNINKDFEIDRRWCDFFGLNATFNVNGYLKKRNILSSDVLAYSSKKLVSIAIPCYEMHSKGVEFLDFSLSKIHHQTYKNIEVIISDHSQDDGIKNLCTKWEKLLNIKYFKNENKRGNSSANLNNAILKCTGDLIKILFQDDFLFSETSIEEIVSLFNQDPESHWLITACIHSNDGNTFYRPFYPKYNNNIYLGNNTISSPSVLTIRNKDVILFDENLVWLMDCDYYKRLYDKFGSPLILNKINVVNRTWDYQFTNILNNEIKEREFNYIKQKYKNKEMTLDSESREVELSINKLQDNFRDVPTLIRLAELEISRLNQKKARNYLIATLALDPENITAKKLLEKLNNG